VSYGGRWDVLEAAKRLAARAASGEIRAADIDEDVFSAELQLSDLPDPDLFIRTGGDHRVSNFLLWNIAYAELYFTDVLWPDFNEAEFQLALEDFAQRERRFGLTGPKR
jgi:undecaprenyl diphosphate synthase